MPAAKTDKEARRLWMSLARGKSLVEAARSSGMSLPTARKYWKRGQMPSEMKQPRDWRTRGNPFEGVWLEIEALLREEPRLKPKTLFEELQSRYPGRFQDGQLRTLQRHIRQWRAGDGPNQEVYFPQFHYPADLAASDFTDMSSLGVTIGGQTFPHLLYHFVLTYSNWETASICFAESFESLAEGFQKAVWRLGGVPRRHRTDCLSAAVKNLSPKRDFTARVYGLMQYYGVRTTRTNPRSPWENGDCESLHGHLKETVHQALLLRHSLDFSSREEYQTFLDAVFEKKNAGRTKRFEEERAALRPLPAKPLPFFDTVKAKVRSSSTINVKHNVYSVPSRLIDEDVTVRVFAEHLEIWYADRCIERLPRLRGRKKHHVNYRHVIDSLVRKPGAFENYRWRDDLFPSVRFRMAYDELVDRLPARASREYLAILHLAARESESAVEGAIERLLEEGRAIDAASVKEIVQRADASSEPIPTPAIPEPDFEQYNGLFETDMMLDVCESGDIGFMEIDPADGQVSSTKIALPEVSVPLAVVMEGYLNMEDQEHGDVECHSLERGTDGDASRTSLADSAGGVRGGGSSGRESVAQLRAVSRGVDSSGMRGASDESYCENAAGVENSAGEDAGVFRDGAVASQGSPAGENTAWRRLPRPG